MLLRYLRYPLPFSCTHSFLPPCVRCVSQQWVHNPTLPFPTHRLPWVGFPAFNRYYESAKTSEHSSHFLSLSVSDTFSSFPLSLCLPEGLLQDGEPVPATPGLGKPVNPIRPLLGRKCSDLPGSQETPIYICHVLRPRSDIHARPLGRFSAAPANVTTKAPTTSVISRLNIMASVLTVYASCRHY